MTRRTGQPSRREVDTILVERLASAYHIIAAQWRGGGADSKAMVEDLLLDSLARLGHFETGRAAKASYKRLQPKDKPLFEVFPWPDRHTFG